MAESPERKWTTLRKISFPRESLAAETPGIEESSVASETEEAERLAPEAVALPAPVAVLVVHPVPSTARLIRETLEQFTGASVISTADPLRGFELSLQRHYGLFFFAMRIGELTGPMLYELIAKACSAGRGPGIVAPGVVFVREKDDPRLPDALARDVRVKGVLSKPVRIERLLETVSGVLEVRDPTLGG